MVDQYPTIMTALGVKIPDFVQGKVLSVFKWSSLIFTS
jgi:hypothetical protein